MGVAGRRSSSDTLGMKIAVSIPDKVCQGAERLARRMKISRSSLFSRAMKEYLERCGLKEITEAMNEACTEVGEVPDTFVSTAARRILKRSEW
jgi:antitoxin MazE6